MILRQQNPFGGVVLLLSSPTGTEQWKRVKAKLGILVVSSSTIDRPLVAFECTLQGVALGQLLPRSTRYSLSWPEGPLDDDPGAIDPHP